MCFISVRIFYIRLLKEIFQQNEEISTSLDIDETRMCYFCLPEDDNQEDTKEIITYIEEQTKNEVANCSSSSIINPMNLINCTNQDMVCATITKGDSMNSDWVARTCMMIGEKSSDYIITSGVAIKRESPDIMVHFCSENKCNG
ncbi:hypothetical protein Anas_12260, partial [Armadillidium nasatum]